MDNSLGGTPTLSRVAVVVDSRNVAGQITRICGVRARPSVVGVRAGLARFGLEATEVHVGLALARARDLPALQSQHDSNKRYMLEIEAEGGHALLGELHVKPGGKIEEKIVDGACNVQITRYVEEIRSGGALVEGIVVISQDIDLQPGVQYAIERGVPVVVAASEVIDRRDEPHLLLPPATLMDFAGEPGENGHAIREAAACALEGALEMTWTVATQQGSTFLEHATTGLRAVPLEGIQLPADGSSVRLKVVDIRFDSPINTQFPVLVCGDSTLAPPIFTGEVIRRTRPNSIEFRTPDGRTASSGYPPGGVGPGDRVIVHMPTGRVVGRLASDRPRVINPDDLGAARIVNVLIGGGYVGAALASGARGLVIPGGRKYEIGDRVPVIEVGRRAKGPVWMALGSPLPEARASSSAARLST